ncbi:oxygenase MpaB family protein [Spirosoma koreense]
MPIYIKPSRVFSDEQLQAYRQQGDAVADTVIDAVVAAAGPTGLRALMRWLADPQDVSVVDQLQPVQDFVTRHAHLPAWAEPEKMRLGMAFFKKHAQQIGLTLGFFSLPYSYLGANGAQVLWLTERIKNDTTRRLQETGEWIFAVNDPKEWLASAPGHTPKAIFRTLKIRLIHAGARWFALHSNRWNNTWGYPVNQEDMAGTNLTFSYVVLLGLRKTGVAVSEQEEEAYLHHINVIDYLNGVAEELLPQNLREAYNLSQAIARRQFAPSEAGVGLTRSLLDAIAKQLLAAGDRNSEQNRPEFLRNLVAAEMRFFIGDRYADWLGIPAVPVEKRLAKLLNRLPGFSTLTTPTRLEAPAK